MRISPVTQFAALGSGAVGATIAIVVLGTGGHASQQPTYVLHQDAATGAAVITSAAPASSAKPVAPKLAVVTSTVVVKQPAAQQEDPAVTDSIGNTAAASPQPTVPVTETSRPLSGDNPVGQPGITLDPGGRLSATPTPSASTPN